MTFALRKRSAAFGGATISSSSESIDLEVDLPAMPVKLILK